MLLTCPTCRSGLQVPDGTTASVRCPSCRTVFSASEQTAPPPVPPPPPTRPTARPRDEEAEERPRRPVRAERDDSDDDDEPRRKRRKTADEIEAEEEEKEKEKERRRRQREIETGLSPEERRHQRAQFGRAMWGCKLLTISFGLYAGAMMIVLIFHVVAVVADPMPEILVLAGVLGGLNWVLSAVGVGLCISGRPSPGHYGFSIAAVTAMAAHAILLFAVLIRNADKSALLGVEVGSVGAAAQLPTKLDSLTFYMACLVYPDEKFIPRTALALSLVTGIAELIRLLFIMMLASCLARAAGENELSDRCTRAGGIGSFGPGVLAVAMLLLAIGLVETGGMDRSIGKILMTVFEMGIYAILAGMLMPSFAALRDTADASESPFQLKSV